MKLLLWAGRRQHKSHPSPKRKKILFFHNLEMASHFIDNAPDTRYVDRKALLRSGMGEEEFRRSRVTLLRNSTTVYVGNLSYYTTERQLLAEFGAAGRVADVVMGLNRATRAPCGFCFVVYADHESAARAVNDLHLTRLDDRTISVSWDVGGNVRAEGRMWGRGYAGGQTRDEYRNDLDKGRAGFGLRRAKEAGVETSILESAIVHYNWVPLPNILPEAKKRRLE